MSEASAGQPGIEVEPGMEIAPFRGVRFDLKCVRTADGDGSSAVTSPPYDVITPVDHRRLLDESEHNITWLTLGASPGEVSSYEERARMLSRWVQDGLLLQEEVPTYYAYTIEYTVPGAVYSDGGASDCGAGGSRARFVGLTALGKLHPFEDGVVLPHERTFPKVVEDRYRLLEATRANLESILLLYSDPLHEIDGLLESQISREPVFRVEAKPGEVHALYPITDPECQARLGALFRRQKPIIADGHHRYTTSLRYRGEGPAVPGADWQMMTFVNLFGDGLSILATHRLVKLERTGSAESGDPVDRAVEMLLSRLEPVDPREADLRVETRTQVHDVRFPAELRQGRTGVAATSYALLHDVVLGEWLAPDLGPSGGITYFKEGTGESEALQRGDGDLLFRMKPVDRQEFESVVQGGEVFPHKTTYFYPKLWSGMVLWQLAEPEPCPDSV